MTNQIKIPQVLIEQKNFCLKIDQNNTKLFLYIENLKKLVKDTHEVYQQLCKKMNQTSQEFQRKIINNKDTTNHRAAILNFVKNMNVLHLSIFNQLNKNSITLNTKSHKGPQNRLQILKQKLEICNNLNKQYFQMVQIFNKKQNSLRQKCEYFNNYQQNPVKYYSLKANTQYYEKLSVKELKVKQRLQNIIRTKDQYKINVSQIRISLQDFYNTELNTISQYKRLLLNIRMGGNNQIYNHPIIQEQTEEAESSLANIEAPLTKKSQTKQLSPIHMRKEIVREYEGYLEVQESFQQFMAIYKQAIELTGNQIDSIRDNYQFQKIISQKLIMTEILSAESLKEIDQIINELSIFKEIVSKLINIFGVTRVLIELKKYRGFNFDKFIQDTNQFIEEEKKNGISIDCAMRYKRFEQKFYQKHNEFNIRYQQRVVRLQKDIYDQYYFEGQTKEDKSKRSMKNNLFQKKHYEILAIPFFLNKMENYNYIENKYLKKFSNHLNANKIQKMVTLTGFFGKGNNVRTKSTCCGLVKKEQKYEGPKLIDDFNCALMDSFLIQGKLKLYENYLRFYSTFNTKTILFGSTDLRIPKWDIINFSKETHILSLMINVQTNYGTLSFTSFITNPYDILAKTYNNRKNGMLIAQNKNIGQSQLQILQARFQSEFRNGLRRKDIVVDKLSTYLSEDIESLSVSIQYHLNGDTETVLFQIKMNYLELTMQYMFIHDEAQKNNQVKLILEEVSKTIINKKVNTIDLNQSGNGKNNKSVSLDFEESCIYQNQINKVSFLKEPSFIKKKNSSFNQESFRNSQVQLGQLLGSKNFFSDLETSKNIKILQQKILLSDQNLSKSTEQKQSPISRLSLQQFQTSTYNKTLSPHARPNKNISSQTKQSKLTTIKSKGSSQTSNKAGESFSYKTIFLFLAILLGLNLMLNAFY